MGEADFEKWMEANLTPREKAEVRFCREYANNYAHGTDGHNIRMLVAKLSEVIERWVTLDNQQAK